MGRVRKHPRLLPKRLPRLLQEAAEAPAQEEAPQQEAQQDEAQQDEAQQDEAQQDEATGENRRKPSQRKLVRSPSNQRLTPKQRLRRQRLPLAPAARRLAPM